MSSSLTLKVGNMTSTVNFSKTDAEVGKILLWFAEDRAEPAPEGLTQAERNQWHLDQATQQLVRHVRQEAMRNRRRQLVAEQASIDAQAEAETSL
jgi:hypothetical protein